MENILLGKTGQTVARISLGTWSYGGENKSGNISVGWAGQKDVDSQKALVRAWERGINHWDTADVYGNGRSEQVIGAMWEVVPRNDVFLASKVGWDKGGFSHYYDPSLMRRRIERSLKNLQVDEIDLYYLHHCNFDSAEIFNSAVESLYRFRDEGKIRFIGLSDWSCAKIMEFIRPLDPDVVQPYRNVMDDDYDASGLKTWVEDQNLGVCFFSPIKHGLLTGKYKKPVTFPEGDFRRNVRDFENPDIIKKMQKNRKKLEKRFADHPQPVLHGVIDGLLSDSPTGCALLGMRNPDQVDAATFLGAILSREDARFVRELYQSETGT